MNRVKRLFGITYREYYNKKLYDMPEGMLEKEAAKIQDKKERKKDSFKKAMAVSGLTREEIIADIKRINDKGIKRINIFYYEKFQLYVLNEEELEKTLELFNVRNLLKEEIKSDFVVVDKKEKSYSEVEPKIEKFIDIVDKLMTPVFKARLEELYYKGRSFDESVELDSILVDMEATRLLLGFSFGEYMSFGFENKSLAEKRTYLSNRERLFELSKLNDEMACNLLNNKAECFNIISDKFGRDQVHVGSKDDLDAFKLFCKGKTSFVKKSLAKSMGKGIELISINENTNLEKLCKRLLKECVSFVAEDAIIQHRTMKAFNPPSVNTVRVETLFDGNEVKVIDAFVKFGRGGSFVDNAGAGGVFAAVDPDTGIIKGNGFDEFGKTYTVHPETGKPFKGYRLKKWKKALKLVKECGDKFPQVSFIGWDIAYTHKRKWIIVEGNAKPQIICNQTSQGIGLKQKFLSETGGKEV